jgi:hypothetical protein
VCFPSTLMVLVRIVCLIISYGLDIVEGVQITWSNDWGNEDVLSKWYYDDMWEETDYNESM